MSADLATPLTSRKSPIGHILKGSMVLVGGMIVAQICGYGFRLLVARLGPKDYGMFALGLAILGVATTVASIGLPGGIARYVPFFHGKGELGKLRGVILASLGVVTATSLVVAGSLLLLSQPLSNLLAREREFRQILLVLALALPIIATKPLLIKSLVTLHRIELRVLTRDLFENVVKLGLAALLIVMGYGLLGAVWAYVIAAACAWGMGLYLLERRVMPVLSSSVRPIFQMGELLTFSLPLFFTGVLALFQQWTDTFMLSYFRTMTEVGLYNVALLVASLVSLIPNLILPVAFPHVINYYGRGERDDARMLARQVSRWILLVMLPATLWLVMLRRQLLPLLFGNSYMAGGWVVAVLAIGYLALSLSLPCRRILSMVKRTDLIFKSTALSVVVNVVGNLLLIPTYGIVGAAAATAGAMVVHYLLVHWWAYRSFSFTFFNQRTPLVLGALLMAGGALVGVEVALGHNLLALIVGTLAFGSTYVLALPLLGALDASDWDVLRAVGERVKQRGWRDRRERRWSPSLVDNPEEE